MLWRFFMICVAFYLVAIIHQAFNDYLCHILFTEIGVCLIGRSSRSQLFEKIALKNFVKLLRPVLESLFDKVVLDQSHATLLKIRDSGAGVFL